MPLVTAAMVAASEAPNRKRSPRTGQMVVTRDRIMQGAVSCLGARGVAGFTTAAVADYARVAEATLFRHFPRRSALIAAALAKRLDDLFLMFVANVTRTGRLERRVSSAVNTLWEAFRDHSMSGIFDVYIAARTDHDLQTALTPILDAHRARILRVAAELLPELSPHPDFELFVDTIVYSMQGARIATFGVYDDGRHPRAFKRLARLEVGRMLATMPQAKK